MNIEESIKQLDSEIDSLKAAFEAAHYLTNTEVEELEEIIDKAIKLGELYSKNAVGQNGNAKFFSHDFNSDGFKYHDSLDEAKADAEASIEHYRDQVADGRHIAEMGEFNELCYGVVIEKSYWTVSDVVNKEHHAADQYTKYETGTEILELGFAAPVESEK